MLDYRAGLICAIIANVNRDPKKRASPFQPRDFMPKRGRHQNITPEHVNQRFQMIAAIYGNNDKEK